MTIGESRTVSTQVDGHNTAAAVHSGSVEVFATPMMIALMERAASELAERFLEPAQTTVGTGIEVSHTAATPVGMRVEATATLTDVKGRLLTFSVCASDEHGPIGEGIQQRMIVDRQHFIQRAENRRIK